MEQKRTLILISLGIATYYSFCHAMPKEYA